MFEGPADQNSRLSTRRCHNLFPRWSALRSRRSQSSSREKSSSRRGRSRPSLCKRARSNPTSQRHPHPTTRQKMRTTRLIPGEDRYGRSIYARRGDGTRPPGRAVEWACSNCGMRSRAMEWSGFRPGRARGYSSELDSGMAITWALLGRLLGMIPLTPVMAALIRVTRTALRIGSGHQHLSRLIGTPHLIQPHQTPTRFYDDSSFAYSLSCRLLLQHDMPLLDLILHNDSPIIVLLAPIRAHGTRRRNRG